MMISSKIRQLSSSPILVFEAKVKQLQGKGIPVVNFSLGEPDFSTPEHIKKAGIKAIEEDFTHYTLTQGISDLRKAIARKLLLENKIFYQPKEIVVGVGTKQLLYHAFQVLCETNDEVLIPVPTWSTYVEQVKLAGGKPIFIELEPPFKLSAKMVAEKISSKSKILVFNSPSNPTGAMIEKVELVKISKLALKYNLWVISDEIYEKIIYEKKNYSIASLGKKIRQKTITVNGFSKAYAMTGWRIGYAAGPQEVIEAMVSLQSQTTSNTCSISQKAALVALTGSQSASREMVNEFKKRLDFVVKELLRLPQISFVKPEGAFYVFVCIKRLLNKQWPTSSLWCQALFEKKKVAVVPGEAFLKPGYFRLSFSVSKENLKSGITKIKEFIVENV